MAVGQRTDRNLGVNPLGMGDMNELQPRGMGDMNEPQPRGMGDMQRPLLRQYCTLARHNLGPVTQTNAMQRGEGRQMLHKGGRFSGPFPKAHVAVWQGKGGFGGVGSGWGGGGVAGCAGSRVPCKFLVLVLALNMVAALALAPSLAVTLAPALALARALFRLGAGPGPDSSSGLGSGPTGPSFGSISGPGPDKSLVLAQTVALALAWTQAWPWVGLGGGIGWTPWEGGPGGGGSPLKKFHSEASLVPTKCWVHEAHGFISFGKDTRCCLDKALLAKRLLGSGTTPQMLLRS